MVRETYKNLPEEKQKQKLREYMKKIVFST